MQGNCRFSSDFIPTHAAGRGWSCDTKTGGGMDHPLQADGKETRMKLSLSARVAESFSNKEEASLNLATHRPGPGPRVSGPGMRASQAGIHSSA